MQSNQAQELYQSGQYAAAAEIYVKILQNLSPEPSFNRVKTLGVLAQCLIDQGELSYAAQYLQEGQKLSEKLDSNKEVKQQRGNLKGVLGKVWQGLGAFDQSQQAYEDSLMIYQELGDLKNLAVINGNWSILAMLQNDLDTAAKKCKKALDTFQQLQEPENEAASWHQLGVVYHKGSQWTNAESAYREAARIMEQQGDAVGAANTYGQIAILCEMRDRLIEAEDWYRKALWNFKRGGNNPDEAKTLHNLSSLLFSQPCRLPEAQQLATDALTIKKTFDPAAAEIWNTYDLLAKIATAQNEPDKAKEYRQLARTTKAAFSVTQYELQQYAQFIELVVAAVGDVAVREQLEPMLVQSVENGRGQLVAAIRRVLAGEREVEVLWDDLDADDSMIIAAILRGL